MRERTLRRSADFRFRGFRATTVSRSQTGRATSDFTALFEEAGPDAPGALDAVKDNANMPLDDEPDRVREDLARLRTP
jgi:hypothetical protein